MIILKEITMVKNSESNLISIILNEKVANVIKVLKKSDQKECNWAIMQIMFC